jgi:hypothetical protein
METKKVKTTVLLGLLVFAGLAVIFLPVYAGNLQPSAPPWPTMKTLNEVEPRVPIHASDLPLTITQPNSYYLVEDINFTDTANHAITIECNNVTIDLMGFTLKGPDSGTTSGIYMNGRSNVEICNGTVRDFGRAGIYEAGSIGENHRIIAVRSLSNGLYGIFLYGSDNLIKGCTASDNGTSATVSVYGIYAGSGSTVTGNTAYNNGASVSSSCVYGIRTSSGSTVTGNAVYYNGYSASCVYGIYVGSGCTVTGNTVSNNGYLSYGTVHGIYANTACAVTGNTAYSNGYGANGSVCGIYVGSGCTVTSNTACGNGIGAIGLIYGIFLSGNDLVDQNTAFGNGGTNMNNSGTCTFGVNHAP